MARFSQLATATKSPSRVIDGPYAAWASEDETCQILLSNNSTIKIGQPVCIDVTQFGPDNNVPNNAAALPLCERVVATTSGNAGPIFGVVSQVYTAVKPGTFTLTYVNGFNANVTASGGVPTYTNVSGANLVATIAVRQLGWGYVLAGCPAAAATVGAVMVGSQLVSKQPSSTNVFAQQGAFLGQSNVGIALATAINTIQQTPAAATQGAGVVSIIPDNMVGIVPPALILIDTLASGVQETVSVGSISYPTMSVALTNAHTGPVRITGPNSNPAVSTMLISIPGTGVTVQGLVATFINVYA
jgi:hypothetical protein